MSNTFFNYLVSLVPGTKARAEDVNSRFQAVVAGFDKLPDAHPTLKGFSAPCAVGTPTDKVHAVSAGDILNGGLSFAIDTGEVNAFVVDLIIAPESYSDGLTVAFKAANAITGASTINLNGLGIKQFCRANGDPVAPGDIEAGQVVTGVYNGTKFLGTAAFAGQFNELAATAQQLYASAIDSVASCSNSEGVAIAQAIIAMAQADISTAKAVLTAADRVQTGLDAIATAANLAEIISRAADYEITISVNANGAYMKWGNGLLICFFWHPGIAVSSVGGALYRSVNFGWTFPHSFNTPPMVVGASRTSLYGCWVVEGTVITTTGTTSWAFSTSPTTAYPGHLAVGFWK